MKYFCYFTNIFAGMVEVLICLMSLYIDYLGAGAGTSSTQEYQPSMVMIIVMIIVMIAVMIIMMAGPPGGDGHHRPDRAAGLLHPELGRVPGAGRGQAGGPPGHASGYKVNIYLNGLDDT